MDQNNPTDKEAFKLQTKSAKETLLLYQWWTEQRANRPSPYALEEGDEATSLSIKDYLNSSELSASLEKAYLLEEQYEEEDTKMLIRHVKLRNTLWI